MNFQLFNFQTKKYFLLGITAGIFLLVWSLFSSLPDGRLHLVFCDVGQGDAIYIKTPKGADILVDGGPDGRVLNCLSEHMPFWDREIELAFLTHPQADHLNGLLAVFQRYKIKSFGIGKVGNDSEGYKQLLGLVKDSNIKVFNPSLGEKISFDDEVSFDILWPYYDSVLGAKTTGDLNTTSTVLLLKYKDFDALLMGDADSTMQDEILRDNNLGAVEVLKVPHHGSKTALLEKFLETISPKLAVISVGKNSYGHPAGEILERLKQIGANIKRTDEGEVRIESDGAGFF